MASPEDVLTKEIQRTYAQAAKEIKRKTEEFWTAHKAKAAQMLADVAAGKITQADYKKWLRGQVFTGERWKQKLDDITKTYVDADKKAREIIGGTTKNVFVDAANRTAYDMEKNIRGGVSFDLYDGKTVSRLLKDNPKMLPEWKIDEPKDYIWNEKRVRNAVAQGIIQGESIADIGKRLTSELATSNGSKMDMFARTAVTGAQNAGRMERLHEAEDMGIEVKKQWIATHDSRVRDTHAYLDGQIVGIDEKFEVDGMEIDYPGDPLAPPELVYNCRCTLAYIYPKYQKQKRWEDQETGEELPYKTFSEWKAAKKGQKNGQREEKKSATNIFGETINYNGLRETKHEKQVETIEDLTKEFKTKLKEVKAGSSKAAGTTQISGTVVNLGDNSISTAVHEFAHTISIQNQTKFGLYDEKDFWKEISKIHSEYKRDVKDDVSRWISSYEHGEKGNDEFMAEAFTLCYLKENGMKIPEKYGSDFVWAEKVYGVVKKYFGRK